MTGKSQAGLDSAQKEIGEHALVVASDARSLTDTFDLLSVSAGFSIPTPLENVTEAVYDEMFNLNAKGPLFAVQKLAPLINRGGSIVLTTSVANVKGTESVKRWARPESRGGGLDGVIWLKSSNKKSPLLRGAEPSNRASWLGLAEIGVAAILLAGRPRR